MYPSSPPNRTTWQFRRNTTTFPAANSPTLYPTVEMKPVGTWVGSQVPASNHIVEISPGVPVVTVDVWAILDSRLVPFDAIQEGDIALDMERNVSFEVSLVQRFPVKTNVGLKSSRSKSSQ